MNDDRWRRRAWLALVLVWWLASMLVMRCGEIIHPLPKGQQGAPAPLIDTHWLTLMA